MLAKVTDTEAIGQHRRQAAGGTFGEEHLPAVSGGRDPGCPVDVDPDIGATGRGAGTGMDAHPDPYSPTVRPRLRVQVALDPDRGLHGTGSRPENREE